MENKLSKRKAVYMALSVRVAVIIWIFVDVSAGRIVTTEANAVPVEFTGETGLTDRGLMRLEEGTDTTVSLELQGTRWDIAKLDKSQLRVQVDLSGVTATGVQRLSYSIRYPVGYPAKKISLSDASSYMVKVNIGELNSKEIEVRPEYVGSVAEGCTAGELVLSPSTLEIRGQTEDIDRVSYAQVTINLDNADSTVSELLDYKLYDEYGNLVESDDIYASADMIQATLPVNITAVLGMITENRVIAASGSEIYVIELPE